MKKLLTILTLMSLFSCSHSPKIYQKNSPTLDIRKYFDGKLEAYGVLKNWRGKITRRFYVTLTGSWVGNEGTLVEHFVFDDNETQDRTWKLSVKTDNHFVGSAHDVVGEAKGSQYGNSLKMDYILSVKIDNKTIDLTIEDWMYLIDQNHLINESKLKKFGITVGSLTIGFNKIK